MIGLGLKRIVLAILVALSLVNLSWASDINKRALELAGQKKFDQALSFLSQEDAAAQAGYEHRFLKARILSWSGQYQQAGVELGRLNSDYPSNPDIQLAMGNLEYYQGNLDPAESYYRAVLSAYPNYEDARTGLANVRKARLAPRKSIPKKWRIDGGAGISEFNQSGLQEWNNQFLRAEYTAESLAYHTSVQRYDRFGGTNVQVKGGIADAKRGGWDWGLEAGFTPDAQFRPKLSAGGRLGRAIEMKNGAVFYPNVTYSYDKYDDGDIQNIQPGLVAYLKDDLVLTGRLIGTVQENEKDQLGWLVQGRRPIAKKLEANLGYAKAPEAINGVAITTKSLFGGLTYSVREDLDLHINLARDDREKSYTRNSVNVGFTLKR